jgi:hypothetical protein
VFQVHQVVPPEIYAWLDEMERGTFEDEGISQGMASNQPSPGIDSAPAQREQVFKEGQRFAPLSFRWEEAVGVDPAIKLIGLYREHMKKGKSTLKMRWSDRKFIHQVDWPDLDEDQYVIRPEASNIDALSPAARTQSALELAQTGWLTPQEGRALLAHPDLRAADDEANAGETHAHMILFDLIKGKPRPMVDEHSDLPAQERVVRRGRLLCITKKAPDAIIDEMAAYLDDLDAVKKQLAAAMAQEQMMMAGAAGPTPALAPPPEGDMAVPFAG